VIKKIPPEWLIKHSIVEDFEFSTDLEDWEYRGEFWEALPILFCTHGDPNIKTSSVKIYHVAYKNKDEHSIGKCDICGKVLWAKIVPRN